MQSGELFSLSRSFFQGLEKRKGMDFFTADVFRFSKGILNAGLQVLISCVVRWLVVHMY